MAKLAFIGGSGIYGMEELKVREQVAPDTPFGKTSGPITLGSFNNGPEVAFLPRHGEGHTLLPAEVPSLANIYALKELGVDTIISLSAVGSLQESFAPTELLVPDQLIDRTRNRPDSFFGDGIAGHVPFAEPFCSKTRELLLESSRRAVAGTAIHDGGTYVCMEGPLFSTKAESHLYRSWGAAVIGMTALPEAKLAREAEICYATLALITDYDCWREEEAGVSADMVMANMKKNTANARKIIADIATNSGACPADCSCRQAAGGAIMTDPERMPEETKAKLSLFYKKYWSES